ncbi:hypothetical protein [Microbacterium lacusdiani]
MPYTAKDPTHTRSPEELRDRIPGWGADLDPADRPAHPKLRYDPNATGAHWEEPEQQPELVPRERSIEHARLTPVFGTAVPLHGLSGVVRRYAYRFSEARAAHWLLLLLGDRIDAVESHLVSLVRGRPDDPVTESGIEAERTRHGLASRLGRGRVDVKHHWMDPLIVAGPWVLAAWGVVSLVRRVASRR